VIKQPTLREVLKDTSGIQDVDVETFYDRVMAARSVHCRHQKHYLCVNNVIHGFLSNFKGGFMVSYVLSSIPLLLRFKFKNLVKILLSKAKFVDSLKLALFAGLLNAVYKAVLCLVRRIYPAHMTKRANQVAAPIAGFIAGMTLILENKFRKQYLAIIALSRFVDTGLNLI